MKRSNPSAILRQVQDSGSGQAFETFRRWNVKISFRRELRLALLAAMETCWVYVIVAFLAALTRASSAFASPLLLFAAYYIALILGRELPRRKESWVVLQGAAIATAAFIILVAVRLQVYENFDAFDFRWLPRYVLDLGF